MYRVPKTQGRKKFMTRKQIVKKLSQHLGVTPKYLSVPSFNYQVTTADEIYTIDRHGVITTSDGQVVSMEEILNAPPPSAVVAEEEITGEIPMEAEPEARAIAVNGDTQAFDSIEVKFPLEGHSALSLRNLINMITETGETHTSSPAIAITDAALAARPSTCTLTLPGYSLSML
jgi:hypothetical protein